MVSGFTLTRVKAPRGCAGRRLRTSYFSVRGRKREERGQVQPALKGVCCMHMVWLQPCCRCPSACCCCTAAGAGCLRASKGRQLLPVHACHTLASLRVPSAGSVTDMGAPSAYGGLSCVLCCWKLTVDVNGNACSPVLEILLAQAARRGACCSVSLSPLMHCTALHCIMQCSALQKPHCWADCWPEPWSGQELRPGCPRLLHLNQRLVACYCT
jgi:hypothetical protein